MWNARATSLPSGRGEHVLLEHNSQPASYAEVIAAWQESEDFRDWFSELLAAAEYEAFRWETPPVVLPAETPAPDASASSAEQTDRLRLSVPPEFSSANSPDRPFEFVLLDSPYLLVDADQDAFASHFPHAAEGIAVFPNLGGDATLVVPAPLVEPAAYGHLAAFVRLAPAAQQQELWKAVGRAMAARIGPRPVWLSTAGGGVPWLHVRLDDRPKYYAHTAYRTLS